MRKGDTPSGVLAKSFEILACFHSKPKGLALGEIADLTGLNKSTAHRLLSQMTAKGFLERLTDGRYVVGHTLFQLGLLAPKPQELRSAAHPAMTNLARETGETVNLAILDGAEILVIDVIESLHEFRMVAKIGSRKPFHTTALGKAMTAFSPASKLDALFAHGRQPLVHLTPNTVANLAALREELMTTRARGYAWDNEECVLGVRAVAAPVFSRLSDVEAAISISGPASRLSADRLPSMAASVINAANSVTARLGGNPERIKLAISQSGEKAGIADHRPLREQPSVML